MKTLIVCILSFIPFILSGAPKSMANINMKNGIVYTNVKIEIPAGIQEEFKAWIDGDKMKIKSDDVESILLFHKDNPAKQYPMIYTHRKEIDYEKNVDRIEERKNWFFLFHAGQNCSVWVYAGMIDVGKNGISFGPYDNKYGYNTFYNFWKRKDEYPVYMKFDRKKEKMEIWLSKFFADDPKMAEKILNQEYRAPSYKDSRRFGTMLCPIMVEDIANDYSPNSL